MIYAIDPGIVVAHLCERAAERYHPKYKDLVLMCLLSIPATLLLASYYALFPLATHMQGRLGYPNAEITPLLEKLHFGQLWPEFGFDADEFYKNIVSKVSWILLNKFDYVYSANIIHSNSLIYYLRKT